MSEPPLLCVRLDDVGGADFATAAMLSALVAAAIPVSCQVVPEWLELQTARHLRSLGELRPRQVELCQHGWSHRNHALAGELRHEFGEGRAVADQRRDLIQGKRRMEVLLGDAFTKGFCPPHNRLTQQTLGLLSEEGYEWVAGGPRTFDQLDVPERLFAPVFEVDSGERRAEGRFVRPVGAVLEQVNRAQGGLVGVVLHGRELRDFGWCLAFIEGVLELRERGWRVVTLAEAKAALDPLLRGGGKDAGGGWR